MKKKDSTLVIVAVLVLAGLYLLSPAEPSNKPMPTAGSVDFSSQRIEKSIDHHMKLGRKSEELKRDLTAIENKLHAPEVDPSKIDPRAYIPNEPIPLEVYGDGAAAKVYRESIERKVNDRALTPDQRITSKINRDRFEQEYSAVYEKEYLKAYIENARRAGYDVKLNSKGEIVEVTEIGTDEPVRFPQSVEQSGQFTTAPASSTGAK